MYHSSRYNDEDDDFRQVATTSAGTYKIPDRDFYRKNISTFSSVYLHFQQKLYVRNFLDRRISQPHYSALANTLIPYGSLSNPSDGICCHYLRRGFTKPNKTQFLCAV